MLPRGSSTTTVVSWGSVEMVTDSRGTGVGCCDAHLREEAIERRGGRVIVAERHRDDEVRIELRDELRGASAVTGPSRCGTQHDVDDADLAQRLLGEHVADVAQMDRVHLVELEDERGVDATLASRGRRRGTCARR